MVKLTPVTQVWFTFAWLWCQRRHLPGIRGGDDSCERGLIQMKKVYCKSRLGSGRKMSRLRRLSRKSRPHSGVWGFVDSDGDDNYLQVLR